MKQVLLNFNPTTLICDPAMFPGKNSSNIAKSFQTYLDSPKAEDFPHYPLETGRKLNVHKTFRSRPGRLLTILCPFNLHPVPRGYYLFFSISASQNGVSKLDQKLRQNWTIFGGVRAQTPPKKGQWMLNRYAKP